MIGIRLQGGPAEGQRAVLANEVIRRFPERIYLTWGFGVSWEGWNWSEKHSDAAEVYRRDEEHDGWLIYLYTDVDLDRHLTLTRSVLALDGAQR